MPVLLGAPGNLPAWISPCSLCLLPLIGIYLHKKDSCQDHHSSLVHMARSCVCPGDGAVLDRWEKGGDQGLHSEPPVLCLVPGPAPPLPWQLLEEEQDEAAQEVQQQLRHAGASLLSLTNTAACLKSPVMSLQEEVAFWQESCTQGGGTETSLCSCTSKSSQSSGMGLEGEKFHIKPFSVGTEGGCAWTEEAAMPQETAAGAMCNFWFQRGQDL